MEAGRPQEAGRTRWLRWAIVALAVVVAVVAWLATRDDDDAPEPSGFEARIVSEAELADVAESAGHSVYWAGPIAGKELEASESAAGEVQVSYVDEGTDPGGSKAELLTIGTYPMADAAAALDALAEREGSTIGQTKSGDEVVSVAELPTSAFLSSPDGSLQIEIYDPTPGRAMGIALSGDVEPVG